jgi:hypothetical protein
VLYCAVYDTMYSIVVRYGKLNIPFFLSLMFIH